MRLFRHLEHKISEDLGCCPANLLRLQAQYGENVGIASTRLEDVINLFYDIRVVW